MNLKTLPLMQKKQLYLKAKKAYYETDKPVLTDAQFDKLEELIRAEEPRWKGFKTGAPIAGKKTKKKLPIPIGSLNKVKTPEQVSSFIEDLDDEAVLSYKLDGAALELVYEGIPTELYTRGDGVIGGDVSFLIPHLKGIPAKLSTKKRTIVRCEGIFTKAAFTKYVDDFDAPRNAASGVLNRKDVHRAVKDLQIVAHQLLEPNLKPSQGLQFLRRAGFTLVPHKVVPASALTFNRLTAILKKAKANSKYECDGLVITKNAVNRLPRSGNPDWAVAFKETIAVEDAPTTKIIAVHWKVSPHGYIIPRFGVEPVKMPDGSTVRFAAAKNTKMMIAKGIGVGAIVRLVKAGDIIPDIIAVEKKAKVVLPDFSLKGEWKWDKTKTHIVLVNPKTSNEFRVQKLARTFGKMKIDFLRGKTVERLINSGFDNVTRIIKAKPEDFERVDGFKARSAQKLYDAIQARLKAGLTLPELMDASGCFPRGVGSTQLEAVSEKFNLVTLAEMPQASIVNRIVKLPGFQTTNATKVAEGLPKFIRWLKATGLRPVKAKQVKIESKKLVGVNVTWTSYRNAEQEETVKRNGGNVVGFSLKKTTVLLYSPGGKASTKVDSAKQAGIATMTWDVFAKKYKL